MSLVPIALRLIASNLLLGKTWADEKIMNMPIFPLAEVMKVTEADQKPVIAVFTPSTESDPLGRDVDDDMPCVKLQYYIYISPGSTRIDTGSIQFNIDMSNVPIHLGIVSRQVMNALKSQDNQWADLWERFAVKYKEVSSDFVLHEVEAGVPIPCLAVTMLVDTVPEPNFGQQPNDNWTLLLEAIRTVDEDDTFVQLLQSVIEGTEQIPDYDLVRRQLGVSKAAAINVGLNPMPDSISENGNDASIMTEITYSSGDDE